jgi:hypothetical protein
VTEGRIEKFGLGSSGFGDQRSVTPSQKIGESEREEARGKRK